MDEPKKLHPILWVAAVSVTVLSIAGVGAILGIIPHVGGKNAEPAAQPQPALTQPGSPQVAPAQPAAAAPPVAASPAPATVHKTQKAHSSTTKVAHKPGPDAVAPPPGTPYPPQSASASCRDCGTIENVRAVTVKGQGSGVGMVAGGLLGGILGHQVGGGTGRDLATVAGAVAGGYAGNEVEKSQRASTQYEVVVRLQDGSTRVFKEANTPPWTIGQPVRLVNGTIQPR
jgi:outer membrane lipoprotein SlyB